MYKYMRTTYTDVALDATKGREKYVTKEPQYMELKLKMKNQTVAKEAVNVLNEIFNKQELDIPIKPKISTLGKNLLIGTYIIIPQNPNLHNMQIPSDIIDVLKSVD